MLLRFTVLALLIFGCSDSDKDSGDKDSGADVDAASECGPRPGGCDDVPENFHMDPACGTTVCGAWEYCTCEAGVWKVTNIDCFGCPDAGGLDANSMQCPACDPGSICVFKCDGDGEGGFIGCQPNPGGCEPGNFACSPECESTLCGEADGGPSHWSCQNGTYCPTVPGAFYCQGV